MDSSGKESNHQNPVGGVGFWDSFGCSSLVGTHVRDLCPLGMLLFQPIRTRMGMTLSAQHLDPGLISLSDSSGAAFDAKVKELEPASDFCIERVSKVDTFQLWKPGQFKILSWAKPVVHNPTHFSLICGWERPLSHQLLGDMSTLLGPMGSISAQKAWGKRQGRVAGRSLCLFGHVWEATRKKTRKLPSWPEVLAYCFIFIFLRKT